MSRKSNDQGHDELAVISLGGLPRASLMPPEVSQLRRSKTQRRSLVTLTAAVVLVVVAAVAVSVWQAAQAQADLAAERAATEALVLEQREYAEAVNVQSQLREIANERRALAQVEILWREVIAPYQQAIGGEAEVESIALTGNVPAQPPLLLQGPLRTPAAATVLMTLVTDDLPDASAWLRRFETVPTYGDASVNSIVGDVSNGYTTTILLNLNVDALAQRFAEGDDQ